MECARWPYCGAIVPDLAELLDRVLPARPIDTLFPERHTRMLPPNPEIESVDRISRDVTRTCSQ